MERDPDIERDLLARLGADPVYLEQVLARLEVYEAAHGNSGWERPLDDLLQEILEELADVTGWGVGANYQVSDVDRGELVGILAAAAELWRRTRRFRELLAERAGT